ncbi:MAG TPA: sugar transferase [Chthonomonadales bacterium]|nr:sugar transferase [Chthonomonadales bacterium]
MRAERAKRLLDVCVAGLLLLLLLPLLLLFALLVWFSSPGPVLFRQQRVGKEGRLFWLYKFRTMYVDGGGPSITAHGDARITPMGRWLRRWKLDELPQLLNVLRGEMSLVGPRPEVPEYVQLYTEEQRQVLNVRPGITGVTQLEFRHEEELLAGQEDVEAYYRQTILPAKLRLDLRYVRERTLLGDLCLLWRTLLILLRRKNPAGITEADKIV